MNGRANEWTNIKWTYEWMNERTSMEISWQSPKVLLWNTSFGDSFLQAWEWLHSELHATSNCQTILKPLPGRQMGNTSRWFYRSWILFRETTKYSFRRCWSSLASLSAPRTRPWNRLHYFLEKQNHVLVIFWIFLHYQAVKRAVLVTLVNKAMGLKNPAINPPLKTIELLHVGNLSDKRLLTAATHREPSRKGASDSCYAAGKRGGRIISDLCFFIHIGSHYGSRLGLRTEMETCFYVP